MTRVIPDEKDNIPLCPDNSSSSGSNQAPSAIPLELLKRFRLKTPLARECASEFLSTFIMMGFGTGSGVQVALSNGQHGNYTHITLCWGIAVMLGIHVGGAISGAHMNPAMSFTFCVFGKLPWYKFPGYCASQCLGAFFAAWTIFLMYYPALIQYDPDFTMAKSGKIFVSAPQTTETLLSAFITEILCTAFLVVGVMAIGNPQNPHMSPLGVPIATGLVVVGIGMAFGLNTGYAVNPATDFAARLFATMAGWGPIVFTTNDGYWWIPIVAPCIGGVLGGAIYMFFIGAQI